MKLTMYVQTLLTVATCAIAIPQKCQAAKATSGGYTVEYTQTGDVVTMELSTAQNAGWLALVYGGGHSNSKGFHCDTVAGTAFASTGTGSRAAHRAGPEIEVTVLSAGVVGGVSSCKVQISAAAVPQQGSFTASKGNGGVQAATQGQSLGYGRHGRGDYNGGLNIDLSQAQVEPTSPPTPSDIGGPGGGQPSTTPPPNSVTVPPTTAGDISNTSNDTSIWVGLGFGGAFVVGAGYMVFNRQSNASPPTPTKPGMYGSQMAPIPNSSAATSMPQFVPFAQSGDVSQWKTATDPVSGKTYYYNRALNKVQWTSPHSVSRML